MKTRVFGPDRRLSVFLVGATQLALLTTQLALLTTRLAHAATVISDPGNPAASASALFSLVVGGQPVAVKSELVDGKQMEVAKVSVDGSVEVQVAFSSPIASHVVRPGGYGIVAAPRGSRGLSFTLPGPRNLVVTVNNRPLFLFATPPEKDVPAPGSAGVLHFGPGVHEPGLIEPKTGQTIYLAPGALVRGRIRGVGVQGVTVRGRGILDGASHTSRELKTMVIEFVDSANIVVEGIGVRGAHWWQTLFLKSHDVDVSWVNLMGTKVNNDGIDVDGVARARISSSFIMAGDDCFGWHALDAAANGELATEDVTATDCVLWNTTAGNAVRIGASMETQRFRRIVIDRCHVLNLAGYAVFSDHSDWATVSDLTISNLSVDAAGKGLIGMSIGPTRYSNAMYRPGRIQGVRFTNVSSRVRDHAIALAGRDADHRIDDVVFENVTRAGALLDGPGAPGYTINAFVTGVRFAGPASDGGTAAEPPVETDAGADAQAPGGADAEVPPTRTDAGADVPRPVAAPPDAADRATTPDAPLAPLRADAGQNPTPKPPATSAPGTIDDDPLPARDSRSGCAVGGGGAGTLPPLATVWLLQRVRRRRERLVERSDGNGSGAERS